MSSHIFPTPHHNNAHWLQEVIIYCASRFRAIMIAIDKMDNEVVRLQMPHCLIAELVSVNWDFLDFSVKS